MKKVLVTVTNTGWLHKQTVFTLLRLQHDKRYQLTIDLPTESPYENNLNHIARRFLKGDYDYWLQIDSDNAPIQNPLDLIELDKDVMLYPYSQIVSTEEDKEMGNYPMVTLIMDDIGEGFNEHKEMKGLQQVDAGGSGCMLIARRVIEKIDVPFERTHDKHGRVEIGVDFNFCRKVRDKGFTVWAHYDYQAMHNKEVEMIEMQNAFGAFYARKYSKKESSGKDLVFYCGPSREKWDGETIFKEGAAGAIEGVIYLAQELTKLGWNVTVYNDCKEERTIKGVNYKKFYDWNRFDKQDVTILWRRPDFAARWINSDKVILDLHDIGHPDQLKNLKIDKVFVKSEFHKSVYNGFPDEKFAVIPYGINYEEFQGGKKDPYLLINTSVPDRALGTLIKLFLDVRKRVPKAKLTWAYGWSLFDDIYGQDERMMKWKDDIIESMRVNGIENLDRINHQEINKLYKRAAIFAYPTHFPETFCISALKAQAAGAIPITTDFGALATTVQIGHKVHVPYKEGKRDYDYGIQDEKLQREWIDAVVYTLESLGEIETEMFKEYDWKNIALEWNKQLL